MNTIKFYLCILIGIAGAQVNTEAMRDDEKEGFKNKFSLDMEYEKADTEVLDLASEYRIDYNIKNNFHTFLAIKYDNGFEKEKNQESNIIQNKGFVHLRATKIIKDKFGLEAFTQYEFNEFLLLSSRQLFGAGARIKINHGENATTFFGIGAMNENEKYDTVTEQDKNQLRSTNYIKNSLEIGANIVIGNTCYFQIAPQSSDDYRVLYDGEINFQVSENLSFDFSVNYRYDNEPHGGLENSYIQISNGISIVF